MDTATDLLYRFEALRRSPRRSAGSLKASIIAHRARIDHAAAEHPDIDPTAAYRLTETCFALLRGFADRGPAERTAIQAACEWFARQEEGEEDELLDPAGLADDREVVNHVCRMVGRPDLAVEAVKGRAMAG